MYGHRDESESSTYGIMARNFKECSTAYDGRPEVLEEGSAPPVSHCMLRL